MELVAISHSIDSDLFSFTISSVTLLPLPHLS